MAYGLLYGALTTYHDYLVPDGSENWLCWLMTGTIYGLALLPFLAVWKLVLIRAAILGLLTMLWSERESNAVREELGRGFLLCITIFIFFK